MSALVKTLPSADAAFAVDVICDSTGVYYFNPDSMAHTYTYDDADNPLTDTITDGTLSFRKTYTYAGSKLVGETMWILVD
jgi:YD repeat-containing protein